MIDFIYQYEATIRLCIFLGGFSLLALWEWATPSRALTQVKLKRWFSNFSLMVSSTIVVRVLVPVAVISIAYLVEQNNFGIANAIELPFWLKVMLTFILLDLSIYFQHIIFHALPILWRFHRVHHSDLDCDITTGLRFHPVEILISVLIKFIVIFALGAPVLAVILFEVTLNFMSMFTHSNIHLNKTFEQVLRWFVVTPFMHRVHHSTLENETNSNFSFNISLWDRIFGTYLANPQAGLQGMSIGLDQYHDQTWQGFKGLITMPFNRQINGYSINHRDIVNIEELSRVNKLVYQQTKSLLRANNELNQQKTTLDHHAIVSISDRQGNITYINDKFCEISGFSREELLGKNHRILKSNIHPDEFYQNLWRTISQGNIWHGKVCNKRKDGSRYWVESTISPFLDDIGIPYQYVSIRTDITSLLDAKLEAEEACKAKSEFLSSMSHELRTPMNAILGFSQLLLMNAADDQAKENIKEILTAGEHLLELINQVLELSKLESGALPLSIDNYPLTDLINDCLITVLPIANQQEIELNNKIGPLNSSMVKVDKTRFRQIILNLLSNAIKYNEKEGNVSVDCLQMNDNSLRITISDTGKGLTLEQQSHIFKTFDRAGAENSHIPGTGLGLVISKDLIERMDGSIGFESEFGKGSSFWIQVPTS